MDTILVAYFIVNKRQRSHELYFASLFQNDGVLEENISIKF